MSLHRSRRTLSRFLFVAAFGASSVSAGEIHGSVRTEDGQPVSQAVVRLSGAAISREAVTGSRGEFSLEVPDGSYVATVRGFEVDASRVVVAGHDLALDISLRPARIREDVVVAATRSRTAISSVGVSASVLDDKDLKERQILRLTDTLSELPGISAATTGGVGAQSSLFVRGGESRFARVLIDGVPVNDPGGFFNFGTLLTPDVERVEVVRGSFGTLYGSDALAGVISLQTAPLGGERRLHGSVGGGDLATSSFSVTGSEKRGPLSGRDFARPGEDRQRGAERGLPFGSSCRGVRAPFQPGWVHLRIVPAQYLGGRHTRAHGLRTTGSRRTLRAGPRDREPRLELPLRRSLPLGPRRFQARRSAFDQPPGLRLVSTQPWLGAPFDSYDFPNPSGYANNTDRLFGTYEVRSQIRSHFLTAGGDIERETGKLGTVGETPLSPRRVSYGAFLQDQIAFTSRAFGTLSLRAEHNGSTGTTLVPHASAAWVAARGSSFELTLRASGGAGIKAPSFFESYGTSSYALGNPDLVPERGRTYDAGADLRLGDRLKVQATYFHHQYLDQIAYKVVSYAPFVGTYENLGETRASGVETALQWRPSSHLRLVSSYTFQRSQIVTSASTDPQLAVGKELLRRPRHQGSITAEASLSRGTLSATLVSVGRRVDSDFLGIGLTENPGYTRLDLRAAIRVNPHARILAALENATDANYQEVLGYKALPRRFRISLSLDSAR